MARLNKRPTPDDEASDGEGPVYDGGRLQTPLRQPSGASQSSPGSSFSSDKENRASVARPAIEKGKQPMLAQDGSNKRRKLGDRSVLEPSQAAFQRVREGYDNKRYYDPDQPMAERRAVRKGIRDLAKDLTGLSITMTYQKNPRLTNLHRLPPPVPQRLLHRPPCHPRACQCPLR